MIIGNMKMYMTYEDVINYVNNVSKDVIVCPTAIYIPMFLEKGYKVGIQNISENDIGAYTGEISAIQAKSLGVSYAIIGHSEVRNNQNDTDEIINKKIFNCLQNDLKVILCVGENKGEDREYVLQNQILNALKNISDLRNIIIAYEPVWSIGTGQLPTNEQLRAAIEYIKTIIFENFRQNVTIIYGGSVDENNVQNLLNTGVSGFLIGKASTNVDKINGILEIFNRQN